MRSPPRSLVVLLVLSAMTALGCGDVAGPGVRTLVLIDGAGETITVGSVTLAASATTTPFYTPGGVIGGASAIGVSLEITKHPADSTKPLLTCVDVRLYTKASGGSLVYSQNQALNRPCGGPEGGFAVGLSGITEGMGVLTALYDADVMPRIAPGVYFIRFRVTFPDSSAAEVVAGRILSG